MSARRFALVRDVDVTGISGTGVVAEGIQFSDGTVVLRWLQDGVAQRHRERGVRPTTVIFESVAAVLALHGHDGATMVHWVDPATAAHEPEAHTQIVEAERQRLAGLIRDGIEVAMDTPGGPDWTWAAGASWAATVVERGEQV